MELWLLTIPVILLILLKVYLKMMAGVCKSDKSMEGKVVIITGANSGIGFQTALELAKRKAKVIMACRSVERAQKAAEKIIKSSGNRNVIVQQLDLSSLKSVREFASRIVSSEQRLDVLINNAGATPTPGLHLTEDKLELQFAINHFGHFLLTNLLLDLLKKSAPSRIIVVSSITHLWAKLDLDNLNCEKYVRDPYWIYCSTKLANLLFVRELAKRLDSTNVTVNALHPGGVRTRIARNARWFIKYIIVPIVYPFLKTAKSGAQTTIHLAVSDEVENISGEYFVDCEKYWTSRSAKDDEKARKLWELSEKLTGMSAKESAFPQIS
ncbi:retinol dehydrogenase 13-like [Uloborus diversus]|uniref:retinol dehydrogenase 13-like n=1 Tax=Uloborus diversus TaxID=327109 RepID=UPI00240A25EA|nr:retinol dehydrogenase 13-like [Uloborus diversus]